MSNNNELFKDKMEKPGNPGGTDKEPGVAAPTDGDQQKAERLVEKMNKNAETDKPEAVGGVGNASGQGGVPHEAKAVQAASAVSSSTGRLVPATDKPGEPVQLADNGGVVQENEEELAAKADEFDVLKGRARMMGITFSNNIGVDALRQKINDKLAGDSGSNQKSETSGEITKTKTKSLRQHMLDEKTKLVRLRITNMDPKKKDIPGEILTVANEYLGVIKKYVPYGEVTENGYHVPYCIYEQLRDKQFLSIKVTKRAGKEHVETVWAKEFALEVLPPLSQEELDKLATDQRAGGRVE